MIAVGLSDPGSGEGAGQVLREPPWDTKQALLPADARLHGREELALQMLSIRHRVELIYFACVPHDQQAETPRPNPQSGELRPHMNQDM
ncbi:hypothetical protein NQZ68_008894 [Dissostichus eleginoides]|nr:hypothetical protein NQZ68_008894 [Dissostichus eleginoides]